MGLIDLPSSREFIESVDWVIPSDKRNFSRSTPDWAVTFPKDSSLADDKKEKADKAANQFAKNVQQLMRTGPLGARYSGPVDGKVNPALLASLRKFESALQFQTGESVIGSIVFANNVISQSGIQNAMKILRKHLGIGTKKKTDKPAAEASSQIIKSFQSFFSATQPLIGSLYSGPADGKVNPQLIAAAKQAENAIASAIGNKSAHGALWSDKSKTFNTSPSDLKGALQLIVKHKSNKKASKLNAEGRIVHFSSILINNSL
jgi:deoxyxylulose-5-phosphate synthase